MSIRATVVLSAILFALVPAHPGVAQRRSRSLSVAASDLAPATDSANAPADRSPRPGPLAPVSAFPEERSWRERNAVKVGAIVGGAIGLGFSLRRADGNLFQCAAEVMVPCWVEPVLLTTYGTVIGAFFGWIASLPIPLEPTEPN
jgi:hypothetical protein